MNATLLAASYTHFDVVGGGNATPATDWSLNASAGDPTGFPLSWKLTHRASSYAFIITMLSITVVMATIFTLFGLFMKAEAHKSSEDHPGAAGGGGISIGGLFSGDITGNDDNFMKSIDIDME